MIEVENDFLDEKVNPQAHKNLLEGVSLLRKTQHIKQPTRSEPTLVQDEFHLTKNSSDTLLTVNDLLKVLRKSNKHVAVAKNLKKKLSANKVLPKPLEKPEAERIQRTIGYEKAKKNLSRWDATVARNRSVEQQVFPLDCETIHINTGALSKPTLKSVKSDLMLEMEALESQLKAIKSKREGYTVNTNGDSENEKEVQERFTRDELISRRKEISYLRLRESQKSAKLRMKNKIKSKKYHKLLKREKIKEQFKEFEILRKTNPKLALEKLDKLEKTRIQERASLRHKNTGTWAKNLLVRAKYDKDARKDLAEQLALSRELTQKQKEDDENSENSDSNESEKAIDNSHLPFNPWINKNGKISQTNEITDFVSGYRKYWIEQNQKENNRSIEIVGNLNENFTDETVKDENENNHEEKREKIENLTTKKIAMKNVSNKRKTCLPPTSDFKEKAKQKMGIENGWFVEEILPNNKSGKNSKFNLEENIDVIFDSAEDILEQRVSEKLSNLAKSLDSDSKNATKRRGHYRDELKNLKDLSFKEQVNRPDFDEVLIETSFKEKDISVEKSKKSETNTNELSVTEQINPNKYTQIKPKFLKTLQPDIDLDDFSDSEETNQKSRNMTIVEAFEDDDIVVDFEKEHENDQKKNATEEIDLSLPGWGAWAGCGISKEEQTKRFILKLPKDQSKCNNNKKGVYVNENVNKKLKEQLVSDLPFPFTSVKDYEASMRAPIGRTFVPETAFRMMTRPSIIAKKGHIIDPMDESILLKSATRPKTVVDKRIANMNKSK